MPSTLFATAFQTPGRRAFGRVCELPEGFAWAKKEMGGKIVAAGVVMNFTEEVRAPVFLMATTKLSGKAVTSLMLVVAFVYPEDNPGIVVSLGFHGLTHDWMQKFYGKMLAPATLRRARERWPEATVMAEWPEAVNLSRCEHGAVVERWAAPPAPGRVEKDQNLHHIPAVLHRDGWYLKISELTAEWEMPQLLARLAGSVQALPAGVRAALAGALQPPSGLVPLERDFEPVADDVVRFRSSMLLIGGSPTSPLPALRIAADGTLGWLQRRPFDGEDFFTLKKLRRLNHSDVASLLPTDMPSRTWGRSPSSEVVLADQVCRVPFDLIPNGKDGRPEQVIITNNSMRHRFKLSYDSVYQLQLLQRTSSRGGGGQGSGDSEMQLGPLQPLLEPTTPAHCVRELCRLFEEGNGGWAANAHTARTLRNEMQVQITPESDAQKVLSDARVDEVAERRRREEAQLWTRRRLSCGGGRRRSCGGHLPRSSTSLCMKTSMYPRYLKSRLRFAPLAVGSFSGTRQPACSIWKIRQNSSRSFM